MSAAIRGSEEGEKEISYPFQPRQADSIRPKSLTSFKSDPMQNTDNDFLI